MRIKTIVFEYKMLFTRFFCLIKYKKIYYKIFPKYLWYFLSLKWHYDAYTAPLNQKNSFQKYTKPP